jgi:hypothetical protein
MYRRLFLSIAPPKLVVRIILFTVVVASSSGMHGPSLGDTTSQLASAQEFAAERTAYTASLRPETERELFGMVVRDPFYEYNTDPDKYPNALNRTALERQAKELAGAGVRWIRMEFFADYDGSVPRGEINWAKYDWFIKELAPKYGLKVLALLNVGMVAYEGQTLRTLAFNDPPDNGGSDPADGSNHFIRVFTARAAYIAFRYGSYISAYEIINEPNISWDLWVDSRHGSAEIHPERYSALITNAYKAIKGQSPGAEVLVGGLLIGSPPEGKDHDQFDYLYQLYVSKWVDLYKAGGYGSREGWNAVPWDGIALHPYFLETEELFALLEDFAHRLRDRGDHRSKLWLTEIGAEGDPPEDASKPPSASEVEQAAYLRQLYTGILANPALRRDVPHVFWFKYEDFVPGNYTHNYGLVRLSETTDRLAYHTSGEVAIHKLAYRTYQEIALGYYFAESYEAAEALAGGLIHFGETGQAIAPQFADYWRERGGLARFGYPISRPIPIRGILSQFFERAVFEWHPENDGFQHDVLLRLLGNEYTKGRRFEQADPLALPPDRIYVPETGYSLGGPFLKFWLETGGLAVYGHPISEEILEVSPDDGQVYTVQYFERNRFEYHPEHAGTPHEVQLGLLGANLMGQGIWWR